MKKLSMLALALAVFVLSRAAKADEHRVFVSKIVKINDTQCAVELTHFADEHNFQPGTGVKFGPSNPATNILATFGSFASTINAASNNNGSKILAASPSFATAFSISRDIGSEFDDGDCASFISSVVISYLTDEDHNGDPEVVRSTINSGSVSGWSGGPNEALIKTSSGGTPSFLDLDTCSTTVTNFAGTSKTVGPDSCGDAVCNCGETNATCPGDCPTGGTTGGGSTGGGTSAGTGGGGEFCGNGHCGGGETATSCPADCGSCGDGICGGSETAASCPGDCTSSSGSVCGNGTCEADEDDATCSADCGACGDGICGGDETSDTCSDDCGNATTGGSTGSGGSSGGCSLVSFTSVSEHRAAGSGIIR